MAASFDLALADGITALLNDEARTWSVAFQAERVYVPDWEVKGELRELTVAVSPDLRAAERFERETVKKACRIAISFGQHLKLKTKEELDKLCDTVEEVTDYLESNPQITLDDPDNRQFLFMDWEDRVRFAPEFLDRTKQQDAHIQYSGTFLAVVSIGYELLPA